MTTRKVVRVPPRKIRERFFLIYEQEGCQKAVDFLTKYYRVRKMRIVLDGRRVGRGYVAFYFENRACFTKKGLNKQTVLHELYHHLAYVYGLDVAERTEERAANDYARDFLSRRQVGY